MAFQLSFRQIWREFPDALQRMWDVLRDPSIPVGAVPARGLIAALFDLILITAPVDVIIISGSELWPGLIEIEPDKLIHWWMFRALLVLTGMMYALLCYALLALPLWLKSRHSHVQLACHTLRVFGIMNVLVTILFVIGVNRVVVEGSPIDATNSSDLVVGSCAALLVFALTLRLMVLPIGRYIRHHLRFRGASWVALGVVILASFMNPVIAPRYFAHIIAMNSFCDQVVTVRFRQELASGKYLRDCLVEQCIARTEPENHARSDNKASACPVARPTGGDLKY